MALGWNPCLRFLPRVTIQLEGQTQRVPVGTLTTGPGDLWAFRDEPLNGALIVLHAYGQTLRWVLLTDTQVALTEPTLYACRNWIEYGFRGMQTVGRMWHETRRRGPVRVGRHWLGAAHATLREMVINESCRYIGYYSITSVPQLLGQCRLARSRFGPYMA